MAIDVPPTPSETPYNAPRGYPVLAWLVILAVVVFLVVRTTMSTQKIKARLDLLTFRLQARYLLGGAKVFQSEQFYQQAKALELGSYDQRLRFVILVGELAGPKKAQEHLEKLQRLASKEKHPLNDEQKDWTALLTKHYRTEQDKDSEPTTPLTEEEQQRVLDGLGWFGELVVPRTRSHAIQQAKRTMWIMVLGLGNLALMALGGLVILITLSILRWAGRIQTAMRDRGPAGLYAETFAVWLVLFVGVGYLGRLLPRSSYALLLNGTFMLGCTALALMWPVLRGRSWSDVRADLGLTWGASAREEIAFGVLCYLTALPVLVAGAILSQGLILLRDRFSAPVGPFAPTRAPSHPLIESVVHGDWTLWIQIYFAAAIVAPIVEETVFRGMLYRHLRGWAGRLAGMLVVSFVFAIIHPQGWVGAPALMALAITFNLYREWRDSLVSAMVAHGINNAAITTLLLCAMR